MRLSEHLVEVRVWFNRVVCDADSLQSGVSLKAVNMPSVTSAMQCTTLPLTRGNDRWNSRGISVSIYPHKYRLLRLDLSRCFKLNTRL
uniref:Uncharacterized protein n=1 Tax=Physcomitrium patens TaxID=3218 RepID=A0A2K1IPA2_PHYPA|nr:hypothetical protein PHYPA_027425 [Physcomitrium patens]